MEVSFRSLLLYATSALLVLFAVLYFHVTRNFNYWEKRGVYSIRPTPFFGSISSVLLGRESTGCWLARMYHQAAGKQFFGAYFGDKPALVVRDLELVKNVLVKDAHSFLDHNFSPREDVDPLLAKSLFALRGKKWKHLRAKLTPTFTSGKMKKMFYLVDESGKQLTRCLENNALSGSPANVKETTARYTADIIAACVFGVDANALVDPNSEFPAMLNGAMERESFLDRITVPLVTILPILLQLFRLKVVSSNVEDFVRKIFWDVVEQRKKDKLVRNDFMDLTIKLMDDGEVQSEEVNSLEEINEGRSSSSSQNSKNDTSFKMKGDDFVAQAFIFLLAGLESSSLALTYALYELALNLGVQDKLRDEITTTLGKHGGKLSYDAVFEMTYLDMIISETLRKYPVETSLDRLCTSDYKIPGTEVTIQKGTQVMIPVLGIHTDPEIYPDPEKFDPERFSAENKSNRSPHAHIPFGEGPRICIGMRFAQMQVKAALIHILSTFQVHPCAETPKTPLHYKPSSPVHVPEEEILLSFRKLELPESAKICNS